MEGFTVLVTIKTKETHPFTVQNKWRLQCFGDKSDLKNLMSELCEIKKAVCREILKHDLTFKHCDVSIELV